jgi:DHA1 family bicyclomycin/chloramphenicol resistance-like MFS transporter
VQGDEIAFEKLFQLYKNKLYTFIYQLSGSATIVILGCIGIVNPNAAALCMAPFESKAGVAASLFGFLQWSIAGIVSMILGLFKSTTALPLAFIMTGTALLALWIFFHHDNTNFA